MPKVLVVDDAAFMRMRATKLLSERGYTVVEAENGAVAVEAYSREKPDLVLLDITMPVMDGITALREIRKLDPEARVVMCSAMGQQAMVIESIKAGARDFILKPFEPEKIIAAVRKAVGTA